MSRVPSLSLSLLLGNPGQQEIGCIDIQRYPFLCLAAAAYFAITSTSTSSSSSTPVELLKVIEAPAGNDGLGRKSILLSFPYLYVSASHRNSDKIINDDILRS